MLQPKKGMDIAVRQIVPLFGGQIHGGGGGGGIEGADLCHMGQIVGAAVEQDHIRGSVAAQILNSGQIVHGRVFAGGAGGHGMVAAAGGTPPAVIDAQLGIQFGNDLHPPGLVHIRQQILLGIPGQMLQIEAVGHGNVAREGGNAVTQNRDDLAFVIGQIRVGFPAGRAGAVFVGVVPGQDVQLVVVAVIPHGDIDGDGTLRGNEIAAVGNIRIIGIRGGIGLCDTFRIEECAADAVFASTVVRICAEGGGEDPVAGADRDCYRIDRSAGMLVPAGSAVEEIRVVFQSGPQVGGGAVCFGQSGQVVGQLQSLPDTVDLPGLGLAAVGAGSRFGSGAVGGGFRDGSPFGPEMSLRYLHGSRSADRGQGAGGLAGGCQQIVVFIPQAVAQLIGDILGAVAGRDHRNCQCAGICHLRGRDGGYLPVAGPVYKPDGGGFSGIGDLAQQDQGIPGGLPAYFVIADLIVVDGILHGGSGGGGVPGGFLGHLRGVVHRSVSVMGSEVFRHTVGAVRHGHPAFADVADHVDLRVVGICRQPVLGHTLAAHFQFFVGCKEGAVRGIVKAVFVAVAGLVHMARQGDGDVGKFQFLGGSVAVQVCGQFLFQAVMHGQILLHIPFGGLRFVGTALAPEITHMGQGEVACGDLLAEGLLAGFEQGDTFLILGGAVLPLLDAGAAVGRVDDPDLFSGLLHPFVGITAVGACLARAGFVQQVHGPVFQILGGAVDIQAASGAGQGAGGEIGGIGGGHGVPVAVGGVDHAVFADDGLVRVAFTALHIALARQKQQGNGGGGDGDLIKLAVDGYPRGTDAGGHQGVTLKGYNRRIRYGVFFHPVADLIGGGLARVDDLHSLSGNVVVIVIPQGEGLREFFLPTGRAGAVFVGVGVAALLNTEIVQLAVGQGRGIHTDIGENKVLAVDPFRGSTLIFACDEVVVHGADFDTVQIQPDHIAAIGGNAVFQSVSVGLGIQSGKIHTVIIALASASLSKAQLAAFGPCQILSSVCLAGRSRGQEQAPPIAPALPFHHPGLIVLQHHRSF